MAISLQDLVASQIKDIADRQYWLVRTESGDFYENFVKYDFIGIGWNEITLNDINKVSFKDNTKELKAKKKKLRATIARKVGENPNQDSEFLTTEERDEKQLRYGQRSLSQIEKFTNNLKQGDIVMIPSAGSTHYSFGEIIETPVTLADGPERAKTGCHFIKRKKIRWIEVNKKRHNLDSTFYRITSVQTTISNISDYAYFIEKTISNFFLEDGKSNYVLRVTRPNEIYTSHYAAIIAVLGITKQLIRENTDEKIFEHEIRANVQSPGELIIISELLTDPFWIAMVVWAFCGGGLEIEAWKAKFGTTGVVRTLLKVVETVRGNKDHKAIRNRLYELDDEMFVKSDKIVKHLLDSEKEKNSTPEDNDIV